MAFFGNNGPLKRWPKEMTDDLRKEGIDPSKHRVKTVSERVFEALPSLKRWQNDGLTITELMRIESDVVFGVAVEFARAGHLLLPVHDSLLVPASLADVVITRLTERFRNRVGVTPRLTTSRHTALLMSA